MQTPLGEIGSGEIDPGKGGIERVKGLKSLDIRLFHHPECSYQMSDRWKIRLGLTQQREIRVCGAHICTETHLHDNIL